MKVTHIVDPSCTTCEVTIRSAPDDPMATRIVQYLHTASGKIAVYPTEGLPKKQVVPISEILFMETNGTSTWVQTIENKYESKLRLLELEATLKNTAFIRVSRFMLANFDYITEISPEFGGRLLITLGLTKEVLQQKNRLRAQSGQPPLTAKSFEIPVSRLYAKDIKQKLEEAL